VLLLVVAFIIYCSLFPFEYRPRAYPGGPFAYLLSTWREWDHRGDLISNILLYLPLGLFGVCAAPRRIPPVVSALLAMLGGSLLAGAIEITQFHDVERVTSMGDVYANAIGAGLGGVAAATMGASLRWPFLRELAAHPNATLLLLLFLGYRLYPFVPTIDAHKYWHAVRPMLVTPSLPPAECVRYVITWLFIATIIHSLYGLRRFLLVFPALAALEFVGRIIIVGTALGLTDVVGAVAAYLIWALVLRLLPGRFALVALLLSGVILAQRLQPFEFGMTGRSFGWVPFASFMRGAVGVAMQAFCKKSYQYGGLIWLLGRAGVGLPFSTASTALLLLATSIAQCWLPGRSAEITDATLAMVLGLMFALLRAGVRPRRERVAAPTAAAREHARLADAILAQHGQGTAATPRHGRRHAPYVPPHRRG
jgi:VanZ family protein